MDHKLLSSQIKDFRLPRYNEIPDVGLYLDQSAKYIMGYLDVLEDISLTNSMISNYVKKKLIPNPVKKQYDRQKLALLIFIAIAKSVISLDNINRMINFQKSAYDSQVAYDYFCDEFEQALKVVFRLGGSLKELSDNNKDEKLLIRNLVVTAANRIYLAKYFSSVLPS